MNNNHSELFCDINEEMQLNTCGGIGLLSDLSITSSPNGSTITFAFGNPSGDKLTVSNNKSGGTTFTGPLDSYKIFLHLTKEIEKAEGYWFKPIAFCNTPCY